MKILLFDIETSPMLANIWSLWSETRDMKFVDVDWYVLSWSAKWLDSKSVMVKGLPDYPSYKKDPQCDKALLTEIWNLLDQADIVIGHNAKKFDCKKLNARFLVHGMKPPSPYKVVDTLCAAKASFAFSSNKLDSLGEALGVGRKVKHEGFDLWRKCMNGDIQAWNRMKKYNKQDVVLLEKVYLKLRPFMKNHPSVNIDKNIDDNQCDLCNSHSLQKRGIAFTTSGKYQRYQCQACGKWSTGKVNLMSKEDRLKIKRSI